MLSLRACGQSCFSHVRLFATPRAIAHLAPLSTELSRQEYWSELPHPPPGDLPYPGIKLVSPVVPSLQGDSLPLSHQGNLILCLQFTKSPWLFVNEVL